MNCHGCGYEYGLETRDERKKRWFAVPFEGGERYFCPDHPNPADVAIDAMTREQLLEEGKDYIADRDADRFALMQQVQRMRHGMLDPLPVSPEVREEVQSEAQ